MPAHAPPPALKLPNSRSHSPSHPPPFGIPSYSHRAIPRPAKASRPRITSQTFQAPSPAAGPADEEDGWSSTTSSAGDEAEERVEVAVARVGVGRSNVSYPNEARRNAIDHGQRLSLSRHFPLPAPSAPPLPLSPSRTVSTLDGSSCHWEGRRTSAVSTSGETFLSISMPHTVPSSTSTTSHVVPASSVGSSTLHKWRWPRKSVAGPRAMGELPVYSSRRRSSPAGQEVVSAKTVLGEGPGGRKETEADRLKRLYLCPWDGVSPRLQVVSHTEKAQSEKPPKASFLDLTPQTDSTGIRSHRLARLVISLLGGLTLLLLFANLLLLDIHLLPSSFKSGHTVHLERNVHACLSLFDLTAPSDPRSFPCGTCSAAIDDLRPSSETRPMEETKVLQFCAVKDLFGAVTSAASSSSSLSTSAVLATQLEGKGWMQGTEVCAFEGVGCDEGGRVRHLMLAEAGGLDVADLPESVAWLQETLESFTVAGRSVVWW